MAGEVHWAKAAGHVSIHKWGNFSRRAAHRISDMSVCPVDQIRSRAVKKLRLWLSKKPSLFAGCEGERERGEGVDIPVRLLTVCEYLACLITQDHTEEGLLKLWKGIFYCMWMSDKPFVQVGKEGGVQAPCCFVQPTPFLIAGGIGRSACTAHARLSQARPRLLTEGVVCKLLKHVH